MEDDLIIKLLSNIGVPAAICFYMLTRLHPAIQELTKAINRLNDDIDRRLDKLEEKTRELSFQVKTLQKGDKI